MLVGSKYTKTLLSSRFSVMLPFNVSKRNYLQQIKYLAFVKHITHF